MLMKANLINTYVNSILTYTTYLKEKSNVLWLCMCVTDVCMCTQVYGG